MCRRSSHWTRVFVSLPGTGLPHLASKFFLTMASTWKGLSFSGDITASTSVPPKTCNASFVQCLSTHLFLKFIQIRAKSAYMKCSAPSVSTRGCQHLVEFATNRSPCFTNASCVQHLPVLMKHLRVFSFRMLRLRRSRVWFT